MELPPPLNDAQSRDSRALRILSAFHYVGACFSLVGIAFIALNYAFVQEAFLRPRSSPNAASDRALLDSLDALQWFYWIPAAFLVVCGVLNLISAHGLRTRQMRTLSLVVAGLNCVCIPLGTVLGAFTFAVLMRNSVRNSYAEEQVCERS